MTLTTLTFEQTVSRTYIQLSRKAPFFAVLALFTQIKPVKFDHLAATDGKEIFINPDRWWILTDTQRQAVICHELLHAALLHIPRRQHRDNRIWNTAADIVVNGILASEQFDMSIPHVRDQRLEQLTVEEIYQKLLNSGYPGDDKSDDLLDGAASASALAHHWQQALVTAQQAGSMPGRMRRDCDLGKKASDLNWRDLLWRFLSAASVDYAGYDRRFIGQGLYLDALAGESLKVALAIDTSGSIGKKELEAFQAEIKSILGAYPQIKMTLWYADTELYGPHLLDSSTLAFPEPEGGGGTCFEPFFEEIEQEPFSVAIYLTDGWGSFPEQEPNLPVLWVLTAGAYEDVPFGQIAQLYAGAQR